MTKQRPGVLLVGHGTRDSSGTDQFFQLEQQLSALIRPVPVAASLLEFQEPTIPQAWQTLLSLDVDHVHVAPLLLFGAGHAKQDIPAAIEGCQSKSVGVPVRYAKPLSRHPAIIDLVRERLAVSLTKLIALPSRTAVVMVGRGSHDPCAAADMRLLSEIVCYRSPVRCVRTAFYAMAAPRMPDVIDSLAASGSFDAIVVHPHLLFEGLLFQAIERLTTDASVRHPSIQFVVSDYLGPDRRVAMAIAARCGFALSAAIAP